MSLSCSESIRIGVLEIEELLEGFLEVFPEEGFLEGVLEGFLEGVFEGFLEGGEFSGNFDLPRFIGIGAGDFDDEALDGDDVSF